MNTPATEPKTPQKQTFEATIVIHDDGPASFALPFDVEEAFGRRGVLPVKGEINGVPYRGQINPIGDGRHYMVIDPDIRRQIDPDSYRVNVTMALALDSSDMNLPDDLQEALIRDGVAMTVFEKLPDSHKREYVEWIEETTRPDTRLRRINKTIQVLLESIRR